MTKNAAKSRKSNEATTSASRKNDSVEAAVMKAAEKAGIKDGMAKRATSELSRTLTADKRLCPVILTGNTQMRLDFAINSITADNLEYLREGRCRVQDLPITSRVVNDWTGRGLLDDTRDNTAEWRKFSNVEVAYINILQQCREFGLSSRRLLNTKSGLEITLYKNNVSLLEIAYSYVMNWSDLDKEDLFLLIAQDGRCNIARKDDLTLMLQSAAFGTHFILNLNEVWNGK